MHDEPRAARLRQTVADVDLASLAAAHGAVGAVLGVAQHGDRAVATAGVSRAGGPPVERSTRFLIASVVKALVATTVAADVEDGQLDHTTEVVELIPSFGHAGVSVDHLLTHTSGLPDRWPPMDDDAGALERFVDGLAEEAVHAAPGERYGYSNAGYATLGRLLEVVHGAPFEAVLHRRLLGPLGLRASFRAADVPARLLAQGHGFDAVHREHGPAVPPSDRVRCRRPARASWPRSTTCSRSVSSIWLRAGASRPVDRSVRPVRSPR
ncbi:MAG: serine hydrolase domain-containing protein [Ilumatobacteraceae bacterium]